MSAYPSLAAGPVVQGPLSGESLAALAAVPLGHAIELASYFPLGREENTDALVVETRRHLGGCLLGIETALQLAMGAEGDGPSGLSAPLCWPMVNARPTLISPPLLGHMRLRAGASLILRDNGGPDGDEGEADDILLSDGEGSRAEAAALFAMAEGRWAMAGGEWQPMRADLPAEYFAELLWTAIACLAFAAEWAERPGALERLERAGHALLARHDEAANPLASADRLVRRMGVAADEPELPGRALAQRRFLLFVALIARRLAVESDRLLALLLTGTTDEIAALCAAWGGSGADLRHLLMLLRAARPSFTDIAIVAAVDGFGQGERTSDRAEAWLQRLRAPAMVRAKLALLDKAAA
ncbi:MAG: hypothetical protein ABW164_06280 [Sphingobium sp.]